MNAKNDTQTRGDLNEAARYIFIVVGVAEVVCGVFGNLILLATLINRKSLRLRNVHYLLIANLALTDLVIMGYWFPVLILDLILRSNPLSETHCRANGYIIATCTTVSILSLMSISLNRYLNVCHPHLFTKIVTLRHTYIYCILTWIISFIIAMPPLFGVGEYGYSHDLHVCSFIRRYKGFTHDNYSYYIVIMVCTLLTIPMFLVGYWNFAIFRHWKSGHLTTHSRYPLKQDSHNDGDLLRPSTTHCLKNDRDVALNTNFKDGKNSQNDKRAATSTDDSSEHPYECTPSDKSERSTHQELEQSKYETTYQEERNSPHSETRHKSSKYFKSPQIKRTRSSPNQRQPVSAHVQQLIRQARKIRAREKAFVRSLFIVFLLMALSLIPFVVITIVHTRINVLPEVNIASDLFLFLNSAVNWIVYGVMNRSFRLQYASLLRLLCDRCFVRYGQRQVDLTNDSMSSVSSLSLRELDILNSPSLCEVEVSASVNQFETKIN